jgi:hypothetical protein
MLPFYFLQNTLPVKHKQFDFAWILYGCETWSLTRTEGPRLRVFVNRVLREIFGPNWVEVRETGENYIMKSM